MVLCASVLVGCETIPGQTEVDRLSAQARVNDSVPTCATQQECQNKWDAAQAWLSKNAGFKIQTSSNAVVETYNSPEGSMEMAMKIIKEPIGDGKSKISLTVGCGNWLLGCNRNPNEAMQAFNDYVNAVK